MSMMPDSTPPPPARRSWAVDSRGPSHPRPAICPLCGLTADNGIVVRNELVATATFVDTNAHLFAVTWVEVAA